MEQSNPDRKSFHEDLAQILGEAYALTLADIAEFMTHYGWNEGIPRQAVNFEAFHHKTISDLLKQGVDLVEERHKGTLILRDGNIDPEKTDLAEAKARINESRRQATEKSQLSQKAAKAAQELSRHALKARLAS
jgi:hypothetical protein